MTRVLIANHVPIYGSGTGTYIQAIAAGLARRGHDVALLTPPGGSLISMPTEVDQFFARGLASSFPSFTGNPSSPILYSQLSSDELADVTSVWERSLDDAIRSWGPTVVHSQHLWVLTSAALNLKQTVVATCHGSEIPYLDAERAERFRDKNSPAAVISVSRYIQRLASSHLMAGTPHMAMLNPVDSTRFSYGPRSATRSRPRVGYVGRLVKYKRPDRFLEIVHGLVDLVPDLEAWIVGRGSERLALEQLSASLGLGKHVRFIDSQPLASMPAIYRDLDVLITCSPNEPFGLVAVEAAACGVPVFVPTEGGLGELAVNPYIPGYSLGSLAGVIVKIASVLTKRETESQRMDRSQYVAERYSLDSYLDRLETIYSRVIERRPELSSRYSCETAFTGIWRLTERATDTFSGDQCIRTRPRSACRSPRTRRRCRGDRRGDRGYRGGWRQAAYQAAMAIEVRTRRWQGRRSCHRALGGTTGRRHALVRLEADIRDWIEHRNQNTRPFACTEIADETFNSLAEYQSKISD